MSRCADASGRGFRLAAAAAVLAAAMVSARPAGAFLDSINPFADTKDQFEGRYIDSLEPGPWKPPQVRLQAPASGQRSGEGSSEAAGAEPAQAAQAVPVRVPDGVAALRMAEDAVADVPDLEAYLNRIGGRVVAGAPITAAPVRYHITANEDFGAAKAFPDGAVGIPVGLLRALDSEDELAFILAHEAAHVLLGHHDLDWIKSFNGGLVSSAEIGLAMGVAVAQKLGRNDLAPEADKIALAAQAVWMATDKGLFPSFTREQEDEADLLGLDLIVAGGYNPDGAFSALNQLQAWEKAIASRPDPRAQRRAALEQEMGASMEKGDIGGALRGMFESVGLAGKQVIDEVSVSHRAAAERYESLLDYFLREYGELALPDLNYAGLKTARATPGSVALFASYENARAALQRIGTGALDEAAIRAKQAVNGPFAKDSLARYAFAATRFKQGRADKAMQNLEIALTGPRPSLIVYQKLAELQWTAGRRTDSVALLHSALKEFEEPPELYADIIYRYHALGQQEKADQMALECKLRNRAAGEVCQRAAKGEMPHIGG